MKLNLIVISLFLLVSIGFTFMLTLGTFYQSENSTDSKFDILDSLLAGELKNSEEDVRKIIQLLKQDENIEDKFIMTSSKTYPYYTNSKLIYTQFTEGSPDDTIEDFITKKNWSDYERYFSANNSIPFYHNIDMIQTPDYLIYNYSNIIDDPNTTWYKDDDSHIIILQNPENPDIPKFLNLIFFSTGGNGGVVVYEVNLQD
jgi:hypothetical protein